MQKHFLKLIFLVLFDCLFTNVNSQNDFFSSFTINTNYKNTFSTELKDTTGKYGSSEFGIGFNVPVFTYFFTNKEDKNGFCNLSVQNNNTIVFPDIDFLNKTNTLYNLNLGLRGIYFTGNKNLWLSKVSVNFFEDEFSIYEPDPRFSGILLFNRIVNRDFSYHFGLTYRYSFGKASVLPIAGLKYSFADNWKMVLSLPFLASVQYKVTDKLLFKMKLHASGNISYYTNNSLMFGQTQEKLLFRKKSNTFSVDAFYKLNPNIYLKGTIEREGNRKIYFSDLKTEINKEPINYFSSAINPTWFVNVGLIFKLGKKSKANVKDDEIIDNLENDFDL